MLQDDIEAFPPGVVLEVVGTWADPSSSATRLFEAMRSLDAAGLDVLFARDLADVSIGLTSSDLSEGTVAPGALTFTAVDWNTPQTVTFFPAAWAACTTRHG